MKKGYRTIVAVVSLFLLVLIDQVTKFAAVKCLKGKEAFSLIPGVFELQYLENRGAAFGALQNQRWFFILIVIFVLALMLSGISQYFYGASSVFRRKHITVRLQCWLFLLRQVRSEI